MSPEMASKPPRSSRPGEPVRSSIHQSLGMRIVLLIIIDPDTAHSTVSG